MTSMNARQCTHDYIRDERNMRDVCRLCGSIATDAEKYAELPKIPAFGHPNDGGASMHDLERPPGAEYLWSFKCSAIRRADGMYEVTVVGNKTGETRKRVGYHPMWELIRILAQRDEP